MNGEPHPEVVNRHPPVLIVGYGHVGRQVAKYFPDAHYVDVDGVIKHVAGDQPVVMKLHPSGWSRDYQYYGFICVPTPEMPNGRCDTSIVKAAYREWRKKAMCWCIKSTVEVGATESLGPDACFSPEYYGETLGHPLVEPSRQTFIILGGPPDVTQAFADLWTLATNSQTRIFQTDAKTAELCKLMENAWLATKVSFCNEFFDLARMAGIDWHTLREVWLADPRVGRSHTYVYPENRGFGGKCLPKDTSNLCAWARQNGMPAQLIEAVRAYNQRIRASYGS